MNDSLSPRTGILRFVRRNAQTLLVILAAPALLIVMGMNQVWAPATAFTRAIGLPVLRQSAGPLQNTPAPAWTATDLTGKKVTSADFAGKVVLVNFWATWCLPCLREIPDFIAIQEQYRSRGFVILGISVDEGDNASIQEFITSHQFNYPVLRPDAGTTQAFGGISGIPASFLIDIKGQIVLHHTGALSAQDLKSALDPILPATSR